MTPEETEKEKTKKEETEDYKEKGYQCLFSENGWHDPFYGFQGSWRCRDCHAKLILGTWYHHSEEPEVEW